MTTEPTQWPASLSDSELETLDRFLRARAKDGDLLLDGVHGLMSALAVGPQAALPEEWLPLVLNRPFGDESEGARVLGLLAKLNDSIPAELDVDAYEPILGEVDDIGGKVLSAAGWCEGFSCGIDLRAGLWEQRLASDPALMELLGPIMALAVDEGVLAADAEVERLSDDDYEQCLGQVPMVLSALAHYWQQHQPSDEERAGAEAALQQQLSIEAVETDPAIPHQHGRWLH